MRTPSAVSARGPIYRDIAREVTVNTAMAVPAIRRRRLTRPRNSGAFDGSAALLDRYAFQALRELERLTGSVRDRSIVEFGPGDHLAAGLSLLAAGASRYAALDRFVPDYSSAAAKLWYEGVQRSWGYRFPDRPWPSDLQACDFPEAYPARVATMPDGVEGPADAGPTPVRYDIVTSWQVGEHVTDIGDFARLTARLLAPEGVAVHRVDFGPHDCWRRYDDPLTFLRFAPHVWRRMSSHRGSPNRRRHHEFLQAFADSGLSVACHDEATFAADAIDLKRVHASFRAMPEASLRVCDVVYVCRHNSR